MLKMYLYFFASDVNITAGTLDIEIWSENCLALYVLRQKIIISRYQYVFYNFLDLDVKAFCNKHFFRQLCPHLRNSGIFEIIRK